MDFESLRKKLHEAIDNDMDISVILELSQELDKEIAKYMKRSLNERAKGKLEENEE